MINGNINKIIDKLWSSEELIFVYKWKNISHRDM